MKKKFNAKIESKGRGAWVVIPFDVNDVYGTRGQVKIVASFDRHEYRGSLAPMGGSHVLGIRKDIRAAIGKDVGDTVRVEIERDTKPRTVQVPEELQSALSRNKKAKTFFDSLSYTSRKEYAQWVACAKRDETRKRRLDKAIQMLSRGEKL